MKWRNNNGGKGSSPLVAMIVVQLILTGLQILSRVILSQGTFIFALMTYRHVFAALCIAPFAFFLERRIEAKLTLMVVFWVFLSSLIGITMAMGLFYYGLRDTTATYSSLFLALLPIATFILSVIARMEKLNIKKKRGKVRIAGTILCVSGALIISLYRGTPLFHIHHHHPVNLSTWLTVIKVKQHWARGTILLAGSCLSYAIWYIVQVKLLKSFPCKYWATMLTCISASIQTAVIGLCLNRTKSAWKLGWDLQLITIVYSGVLASGATVLLITWAVSSRGPIYPAMFYPLGLVFVALAEFLILGQDLTTGSIIAMVVIVVGLYCFLWGSHTNNKADNKEISTFPKSGTIKAAQVPKRAELIEFGGTASVVPTTSPASLSDSDSDQEQHT